LVGIDKEDEELFKKKKSLSFVDFDEIIKRFEGYEFSNKKFEVEKEVTYF